MQGQLLKMVYIIWLSLSILSPELISAAQFGIIGHWKVKDTAPEHSLLKKKAGDTAFFNLHNFGGGRYMIGRQTGHWHRAYFAVTNEAFNEIIDMFFIGRNTEATRLVNTYPRWGMLCLLKVDYSETITFPSIWKPYHDYRNTATGALAEPYYGSNYDTPEEYVIEEASVGASTSATSIRDFLAGGSGSH